MKGKKAISLIVLVITIIVMIILASTIIISLSDTDILDRAQEAVNLTNEKEVQQFVVLAWAEAYADAREKADGVITQEYLEGEVLKKIQEANIDVSDYIITVTIGGAEAYLIKVESAPDGWEDSVMHVVDGVPIPNGFVASPFEGERLKSQGLVIYELTSAEVSDGLTELPETEKHETALVTRNQYVWVPVATETFKTAFKSEKLLYPSTTPGGSLGQFGRGWEITLGTDNIPTTSQDTAFVSPTTATEALAMYKSVQKYGGYYVARYEAGIANQRFADTEALITGSAIQSKMNKIPYSFVKWADTDTMSNDLGGAVQAARSVYKNSNFGVTSTLIYGVQWDTMLKWFKQTGALQNYEYNETIGNYAGTKLTYDDLNDLPDITVKIDGKDVIMNGDAEYAPLGSGTVLGAYIAVTSEYIKTSPAKESSSGASNHALTTGAMKAAKINNIYDVAGNMMEWSMEGYGTSKRITRGGSLATSTQSGHTLDVRYTGYGPTTANNRVGFRVALYINL